MNRYIKILAMVAALVSGCSSQLAAQSTELFSIDSTYLCRPFSQMDILKLGEIRKNAELYRELPVYEAYQERIAKVTDCLSAYDRAVKALDSPFDFSRIVEVRKILIPLISEEGVLSDVQMAEMDRLDILLSRYKGSVALFKDIIGRINRDPVVISYRTVSRSGRPSGEERRKYIAAISDIVYKPSTKDFTDEINNYIQLIPYLKPRFTEYLNSIAQNPDSTPAIETEIMGL